MITFYAAALAIVAALYIGSPLVSGRRRRESGDDRDSSRPGPREIFFTELEQGLSANRREMAELDAELSAGKIAESDHRQLTDRLRQENTWLALELSRAKKRGRRGKPVSIDERIDAELRRLTDTKGAEPAARRTHCPSCGSVIPEGFKFCGQCGTRLPVQNSTVGTEGS